MTHIIVGLGNPGPEYEATRHNMGRMVVEALARACTTTDWRIDKKLRAHIAQGVTEEGKQVTFVLPDNYMNRSGGAVAPLVKTKKDIERLIIVHDDIDLPLGQIRVVFDRGAGGHNGVLSVERALNTSAFVRVRVGVLPKTPSGKVRKPKGAEAVHAFILAPFTKKERAPLDEVIVHAVRAALIVVERGRDAAMLECNTRVPS